MKFILFCTLIFLLCACSGDHKLKDEINFHCHSLAEDYERLLRHIELKGKASLETSIDIKDFNAAGALSFRTLLFCGGCRESERLENYDQLVTEFSVLCEKVQFGARSNSLSDGQHQKLVEDVGRLIEIIDTINSLPMAN